MPRVAIMMVVMHQSKLGLTAIVGHNKRAALIPLIVLLNAARTARVMRMILTRLLANARAS